MLLLNLVFVSFAVPFGFLAFFALLAKLPLSIACKAKISLILPAANRQKDDKSLIIKYKNRKNYLFYQIF